MSLWRQLARGLRALTHRSAADRDVADEVQHYVDQAAAAHIARGLSRDQALRAAHMEIGNVTGVREQVRSYGWENAIETLLGDLRYAARRLRAAPGFTAITVLTLALGVGGTTAIFSAVNPILFEPLPYPHANRVAMLLELHGNGGRSNTTFGMYRELKQRSRSFDAIAVLKPWRPTILGPAEPERLEGQRVSAQYFRVLGIAPAAGRDFDATDDRLNGPRVVIIGDALWHRRFAADPGIIGRQITLDDDSYLVIGVMPAGLENVLATGAQLWAPMQYDMSLGSAWGHHLRTIARLKPGVSVDAASEEYAALGGAVLKELRPMTYDPKTRFAAMSLQTDLTRGVRRALLSVLFATLIVLVIACVNVTNLLLARGVHRRAEFALRAALGAGQRRLIRQLLTESLLLSAIGGVAGIVVAILGVRALVALSPADLPRLGAIRVDGMVFSFCLAITTLCGLGFGVWPARQAASAHPQRDLQQGSRRNAGGGGHRRTRSALVVAEVSLALVLLVGSGLLLRSLRQLFSVEAGFDSAGLLTMQVQTAGHRFDDDTTTYRFFAEALEAVRRVPGVTAAALTSQLPLSGDHDAYGVHFEATATQPTETYGSFRYAVSPAYTETMRIPVLRGRTFGERDDAGAPRVALISESLAKRRFVGTDPIGQRLRIGPVDGPPFTIVGVVGDLRQLSLAMNESDAVYTPAAQWLFTDNAMSLVVRARGDATSLVPAIRQAVWSVDKDQPVVRVATMESLLAASAAERRFALILFEAFALAALVLAAAGIYGVLAGSVAERTREIGVRAALGASRASILALVLREGLWLTLCGVAIGLAGAVAATRSISAMLFGVSPLDPLTYFGVIALLAAVSLIACGVPAWRAARVDPATTLRAD